MRDTKIRIHPDALKLLLTPVQIKYLFCLANGESQGEIASAERSTIEAVQVQMNRAKKNTNCSTKEQLIAVAVRSGLFEEMWARRGNDKAQQESRKPASHGETSGCSVQAASL